MGTQYHHAFMGHYVLPGRGWVPNIIIALWGTVGWERVGRDGYPNSSCFYGVLCMGWEGLVPQIIMAVRGTVVWKGVGIQNHHAFMGHCAWGTWEGVKVPNIIMPLWGTVGKEGWEYQ